MNERKYPRVYAINTEPSMTKQSFKDEVNINKIMAKFQRTGALNHYAKHAPTYGDATGPDLLEAQLIISKADSMFAELPSEVRKKFDNDPALFLDFVQDPKNLEEMQKLGLTNNQPLSANKPDTTPPTSAPAPSTPNTPDTPEVSTQ